MHLYLTTRSHSVVSVSGPQVSFPVTDVPEGGAVHSTARGADLTGAQPLLKDSMLYSVLTEGQTNGPGYSPFSQTV